MSIITTFKFIINHPLNSKNKFRAILRFIKWQIRLRTSTDALVYSFTEKSKLIVERGMTGATGNLYCGLHEYTDMFFLLHFLRNGDLFVDIGANVGSYTVLASAQVGASTISVEPVPSTFSKLGQNISINQIEKIVRPLNIALGSEKSTLQFTTTLDTVNHVATSQETNTIQVEVDTLENVLGIQIPILIKIDVEGFETEVMKGAEGVLLNQSLKAIIIELNGSGERYGYDETAIHDMLLGHGFTPCIYNPVERTVDKVEIFGLHNTIYIRDQEFVADRVKSGEKVFILNQKI
jgi:FkbM family methyltransferase